MYPGLSVFREIRNFLCLPIKFTILVPVCCLSIYVRIFVCYSDFRVCCRYTASLKLVLLRYFLHINVTYANCKLCPLYTQTYLLSIHVYVALRILFINLYNSEIFFICINQKFQRLSIVRHRFFFQKLFPLNFFLK